MKPYIHNLSDVQSASIGEGTRIWQFAVVLPGAKIGKNCNVCANTFIENDVVVGDNVTIKCGMQLWDGVTMVGAGAVVTKDVPPDATVVGNPARVLCTAGNKGAS